MKKTYDAYWDGQYTTAERRGNRWHVGGDVAPGDENVLILLTKDDRPAWFVLRGNRLVFDDYN
jgi:hypothetical protein|tara:strand:- start:1442 stop:1630 length:189 start_codon:yes stop_codon:yes gene_type:complete